MSAISSAYLAIKQALDGDTLWGTRVHSNSAPASSVRPYVVYFWSGGSERELTAGKLYAALTITVKVVAENQTDALVGGSRIMSKLWRKGTQESDTPIAGGTGWVIKTVSPVGLVNIYEAVEGAKPLYHNGHQFRLEMESV